MKRLRHKLFLGLMLFASQISFCQDMLTSDFNSFIEGKDFLGLRVYLRKQLKNPRLPLDEWKRYRELIVDHISATGYDTLYSWDSHVPVGAETKRSVAVKDFLEKADELMLKKDFSQAFALYQKVAVSLKIDIDSIDSRNSKSASLLYYHVLDAMGRSLYSMRRFRESAEVFDWIPKSYPKY